MAKKYLHSPWLMWSVGMSFLLFQFYLQLSSGVMIHQLMDSFQIHALDTGILTGSYYIVYVLLQTPSGMLADRVGPRLLITVGSIITALGCSLFASSHNLATAEIARILMGSGSACAFVCSVHIVSSWFPRERYSLMLGITETVGMCGAVILNMLLAQFLLNHGWRASMMIAAAVATTIAIAAWIVVRENSESRADTDKASFENMLHITLKPQLWCNGFYGGFLFCVITVFTSLWGIPYFIEARRLSLVEATQLTSISMLGIAFGGPLSGRLYPLIKRKSLYLSIMSLVAGLISIWILYNPPSSLLMLYALMFVLGMVCSSYVFNYVLAAETTPCALRSTAIGFTNFICVGLTPLLQPIVGWLLDYNNMPHRPGHITHYSLGSFHIALTLIPLGLLFASVLAFAIPKLKQAHS